MMIYWKIESVWFLAILICFIPQSSIKWKNSNKNFFTGTLESHHCLHGEVRGSATIGFLRTRIAQAATRKCNKQNWRCHQADVHASEGGRQRHAFRQGNDGSRARQWTLVDTKTMCRFGRGIGCHQGGWNLWKIQTIQIQIFSVSTPVAKAWRSPSLRSLPSCNRWNTPCHCTRKPQNNWSRHSFPRRSNKASKRGRFRKPLVFADLPSQDQPVGEVSVQVDLFNHPHTGEQKITVKGKSSMNHHHSPFIIINAFIFSDCRKRSALANLWVRHFQAFCWSPSGWPAFGGQEA